MSKATFKGMDLIIYGFDGIFADCFIKELSLLQKILMCDIEVERL